MLALSDVMRTGWYATRAAEVQQGGTAVVVGDGAVGLSAVMAAKELGAERISVDSNGGVSRRAAPSVRAGHPARVRKCD
jgi:threonine dehydrogenase-like Zn-dependent dehydrogenase